MSTQNLSIIPSTKQDYYSLQSMETDSEGNSGPQPADSGYPVDLITQERIKDIVRLIPCMDYMSAESAKDYFNVKAEELVTNRKKCPNKECQRDVEKYIRDPKYQSLLNEKFKLLKERNDLLNRLKTLKNGESPSPGKRKSKSVEGTHRTSAKRARSNDKPTFESFFAPQEYDINPTRNSYTYCHNNHTYDILELTCKNPDATLHKIVMEERCKGDSFPELTICFNLNGRNYCNFQKLFLSKFKEIKGLDLEINCSQIGSIKVNEHAQFLFNYFAKYITSLTLQEKESWSSKLENG
jgi:hypothetical protein